MFGDVPRFAIESGNQVPVGLLAPVQSLLQQTDLLLHLCTQELDCIFKVLAKAAVGLEIMDWLRIALCHCGVPGY